MLNNYFFVCDLPVKDMYNFNSFLVFCFFIISRLSFVSPGQGSDRSQGLRMPYGLLLLCAPYERYRLIMALGCDGYNPSFILVVSLE